MKSVRGFGKIRCHSVLLLLFYIVIIRTVMNKGQVLVSVNSERNSKTWPARITSWVLRSPSAGLRGTTLDHRSEAEVA